MLSTPASRTSAYDQLLTRFAPGLFVLLWSTGFIGAKFGLPYAGPLHFLAIRFVLVIALLLPLAWLSGATWPRSWREAGRIAWAGLLVHAIYLGGVFASIHVGLSAGLVALIVGLQPLLVNLLGPRVLGERTSARQWIGLFLGFAGVVLVVSGKLQAESLPPAGLILSLFALAGITAGTLYQKRHCSDMDLRTGTIVQYLASFIALAPLAWWLEPQPVVWHPRFVFALVWLTLVLSIGAIFLLFWLIRHGAATRVSSLFYLTPPTTALMAWLMFDEPLSVATVAGMAIAAAGVAIASRVSR